jgi:Gametolysin peptidase M11
MCKYTHTPLPLQFAVHNLWLWHSGWVDPLTKNYGTYDDLSTPMGIDGEGCLLSGAEMLLMGWALPPTAHIIEWQRVQVGERISLRLSPLVDNPSLAIAVLYLGPQQQANRLGSQLTLTYRVARGQDGGLPLRFARATSLHTPRGYNNALVAWLRNGQAYAYHRDGMGLLVAQVSGDDSGASVLVCRFARAPAECGSFSDVADAPVEDVAAAAAVARVRRYGLRHGATAGVASVEAGGTMHHHSHSLPNDNYQQQQQQRPHGL